MLQLVPAMVLKLSGKAVECTFATGHKLTLSPLFAGIGRGMDGSPLSQTDIRLVCLWFLRLQREASHLAARLEKLRGNGGLS